MYVLKMFESRTYWWNGVQNIRFLLFQKPHKNVRSELRNGHKFTAQRKHVKEDNHKTIDVEHWKE